MYAVPFVAFSIAEVKRHLGCEIFVVAVELICHGDDGDLLEFLRGVVTSTKETADHVTHSGLQTCPPTTAPKIPCGLQTWPPRTTTTVHHKLSHVYIHRHSDRTHLDTITFTQYIRTQCPIAHCEVYAHRHLQYLSIVSLLFHCYHVYGYDYNSGFWFMSLSLAQVTLFAPCLTSACLFTLTLLLVFDLFDIVIVKEA